MTYEEMKTNLKNLQCTYPNANIPALQTRAHNFCQYMLRQNWFTDRNAVVSGEGGLPSMTYNALIEAAAVEWDMDAGFKNYMSHLSSMYGNYNAPLSLDSDNFETVHAAQLMAAGGEIPLFMADSPAASFLDALRQLKKKWVREERRFTPRLPSVEEIDYLETLAHVGSQREAADLIGITFQRGRAILRHARRLARYLDPHFLLHAE